MIENVHSMYNAPSVYNQGGGGGGGGGLPPDVVLTEYTRGNGGFTEIERTITDPFFTFQFFANANTPDYRVLGCYSDSHLVYVRIKTYFGRFYVIQNYDLNNREIQLGSAAARESINGYFNDYQEAVFTGDFQNPYTQTTYQRRNYQYDKMVLFGELNGNRALCDIHAVNITDNKSGIVAAFVSAKKGNEPGFWDYVSGQFYGDSSGNNLYTAGPDITIQ